MTHLPSPRRGEHLDPDHPLVDVGVAPADCVSDVDPGLLDEVATWHNDDEPPDAPVDVGELV
jgi:hypothetical protein